MNIYVIVVTFNGSKWIDKCFGSLLNSSIPLKVLAIDNASTDGTPEIIRKFYPTVEVIQTNSNIGFGKANNIGLQRVLRENYDYAFLLNQDAWIEKDTIEKLVEVHKSHNEFGILSPLPYDGENKTLDYLYARFYKNSILGSQEFTNNTFEIKFINAAGWLMTKDVIIRVGGFHPKFMMHGEDKNYVDRVHYLKNIKIGISLSTKYYHDRQNRSKIENTLEKRLYALKTQIKTSLYDPNINPIKIYIEIFKYHSIKVWRRKLELRQYINIIGYLTKYFFKALPYRRIYFKI